MKDELSEILEEEDPPDDLKDGNHDDDFGSKQEKKPSLVQHKVCQRKKRWKNFSTNKKKKSPPATPKSCVNPMVFTKGEISLIETRTPYSSFHASRNKGESRFHDPP